MFANKFQGDSGSSTGMTEGLRMKELNITSLFVERIAHTVIPDPRSGRGWH